MVIADEVIVDQNTDEWFDIRRPLATSSELVNVFMTPDKSGYRNYRTQKVLEILTGVTPERFKGNKYTDWGHENEDLAAMMYSLKTGNEVRDCGIWVHKWLELGDSPDKKVIDQPGVLEIKCKNSANHLEAISTGHMPKLHTLQVQNHIQMTDSEWCDYVSFDPDFPPNAQLFIERIYKDEALCKQIILQTSLFMDAVKEDIKLLKEYKVQIWN